LGNSILRFGIPSEDRSVSSQENEGFSDELLKAKSTMLTIGKIKLKVIIGQNGKMAIGQSVT